jgi:hypothetical protein
MAARQDSEGWMMRDPLTTMVLGVAGFFAGVGLLIVGYRADQASIDFVASYGGKLWIILIGVQTAFWAIAFGPLWSALRRFSRRFEVELRGSFRRIIAFDALFLALLAGSRAVAGYRELNPLAGHGWKLTVLTMVGAVAIGLPALTGIFEVRVVGQSSLRPDVRDMDGAHYLALRDNLQQFLRIAGATIALATLGTGALRQAVLANGTAPSSFPADIVLQYGALLTILLSLAYVPAFVCLRNAGRDLVARMLPMPDLGGAAWFEWDSKRKTLNEFLQLDRSMFDRLQAGLFILAPLLAAALSLAVPQAR